MSTNDDSTSRRDRRPDQGNQRHSQSRGDGWSQRDRDPNADRYYDDRGRGDNPPQQQRGGFSGFSRHSYPPRQEPPAPPPPQRFEPAPAYTPSSYSDNSPLPPLEHDHPPMPYGQNNDRDDLFVRDPGGYDYNRAPAPDRFAPPPLNRPAPLSDSSTFTPPPPADDYAYSSRGPAPEAQATRFYLPDDEPQAPRPAPQPYTERAYAPQQYETAPAPRSVAPAHYGHDGYDPRHNPPQDWGGQHPVQAHGHGDDLEDDFFADEDDLDHDVESPKKGRKGLILIALLAAVGIGGGGAYAYKYVIKGGGTAADGGPLLVSADRNPPKDAPKDPGGRQFGNGEKTIYSRLMPDGQQIEVPSGGGASRPNAEPARPVTAGNSLEDRLEAWKKAQSNAASSAPSTARPDQPTVVAPEIYGPDGRKVEAQRQVVTPSFASANQGQLPPPFGNSGGGAQAQANVPSAFRPSVPGGGSQGYSASASARPAAPFNTASANSAQPALPQTQPQKVAANAPRAGASTAAAVAGGFYVQIKSGQDEKLAARELQTLSEKFGGVIGGAQMTTKTVDLGEKKGVWIRTVVGPVATKEEASELCTKLKGAGLPSCFVTKSD